MSVFARSSGVQLSAIVVTMLLLGNNLSRAQSVTKPESRKSNASRNDLPHFELGFVSSVIKASNRDHLGLGARGVYNLRPAVALEVEVDHFFTDSRENRKNHPEDSGAVSGGFLGVKSGHRFSRVGLFAKVRPGFLSFTSFVPKQPLTVPSDPNSPLNLRVGRVNRPALDLGLVLDLYLTRHWVIRTDWGDTMVFYNATQLRGVSLQGFTHNNFQSGGSIQYRF